MLMSRALEDIVPLAHGTSSSRCSPHPNESWRCGVVRSTRFWLVVFLVIGVVSFALTSVFAVEGSNNDPLLAEIGNGGMPLAVMGALTVGVVEAVRSVRGRGEKVR
jgi:hypothetical protein